MKQQILEKLSRREFCARLKTTSPESSEEWNAFNHAESLYEMAEAVKNSSSKGHRARNRAVYYFKKGWMLRTIRMIKYKPE